MRACVCGVRERRGGEEGVFFGDGGREEGGREREVCGVGRRREGGEEGREGGERGEGVVGVWGRGEGLFFFFGEGGSREREGFGGLGVWGGGGVRVGSGRRVREERGWEEGRIWEVF